MSNEREMPKYKCHKIVHALKIHAQYESGDGHSLVLHFEDKGYEPMRILDPIRERFVDREASEPREDLGYLVVYTDGYRSWSPTKAFEEGYTRI